MGSISDDLLQDAVNASKAHPTMQAAADALKVPRKTFTDRLKAAARRGLLPLDPAPMPGFEIAQVSSKQDGAWVKQRPEHGEVFTVPKGHVIKGVSALVDPDERVVAKWVKTKAETDSSALVDAIKLVMEGYAGAAVLAPCPFDVTPDLLTLYPIADHHLGMHAWGKETGADYDLEIASQLLLTSVNELVHSAPASEIGVVLNLGDFLHADNSRNMTPASGNILDVDGRYAKVLMTGVSLLRDAVQLALQKHAKVIVRMLPGNHDPHVSVALAIALKMFFASETRVFIDCDPSLYWHYQFGSVMLSAHHGHEARPSEMPSIMAANQAVMWGATKHRFAFLGHEHHSSKGGGESAGATWEVLQTLASRDAWAAGKGYFSGRSMSAITFHRDRGFYSRINKTVG